MQHSLYALSLKPYSAASVTFGGRKKSTPADTGTPADSFEKKTAKTKPAAKANKAEKVLGPKPTPFDKLKIKDAEIIVFDIETTGLVNRPEKEGDPEPPEGYDDLTELSAIKYKNGKEVGRFKTLVKPRKPIPAEVEEKTQITNEMVQKDGRPTEEVLPEFFKFIGENPIMVGHNAKWFDTKFLRETCRRYDMPELTEKLVYDHVVDTNIIAKKLFPDCVGTKGPDNKWIPPTPGPDSPKNLKLTSLAEYFGFDTTGAHRAENDVLMAAKVLMKLLERAKAKGIPMETFGDIYQLQYTPPKPRGNKKPVAEE